MRQRQSQVRSSYRAAAKVLVASADPRDQALGRSVEAFVKAMPAPVSRRVALARSIAVEGAKNPEVSVSKDLGPDKDRTRGR